MAATMNPGMCRCCAAEGSYKDFRSVYHWMGEQEVYADMLLECFDVTLSSSESGNNGGICELCITQLRNASNFKKQVLQTEQQFVQLVNDNAFKVDVKLEDENKDTFDDSDHDIAEDFSAVEFEAPVKEEDETEEIEAPKTRKRAAKASTSKAKKAKKDATETSTKSNTGQRKTRQSIKATVKKERIVCVPEKKLKYRERKEKTLSEMKKQWHNLTTILNHSNATPFKDRNDAGYVCAYCFKNFPSPEVLRTHTHTDHVQEKPSYKAGSGMSSFVAFLDIVDLKCTVCDQPKSDLNDLTQHLVDAHEKKYFLGVTDYFQPFKLSNEQQMNCCLCNDVFHNMKLLMQHMNVHYRNFICTTCGAGFVNSFRLNRHETTHGKKKTSYLCRHCGLSFAAESKKKAHVNTVHKGIAGDSVCQICKARFKNYYQKTRHMIQVHNMEGIKCDMCEKKFNLKSNLMLHMRSVHLKERPYECSVCSMGFFIKRHMVGHYMATHTNERKFKCEVCGKAYATQNSKRKHMKKNHGITKGAVSTDLSK